jgi:hypothetical protein
MTTRRLLTITLALALTACALPAVAGVEDEPGYIDLSFIEIPLDADEVQDIDLTSVLDDIAEDARAEGEDALAELLGMVRSVRVKWFSVTEDGEDAIRGNVQRVLEMLDERDWTRIIYIKDDDETVTVSTKNVDGQMVGLTIVVFEPGDSAGFVNVVGDLDLGKVMAMAGNMDLDELDKYMEEYAETERIE